MSLFPVAFFLVTPSVTLCVLVALTHFLVRISGIVSIGLHSISRVCLGLVASFLAASVIGRTATFLESKFSHVLGSFALRNAFSSVRSSVVIPSQF